MSSLTSPGADARVVAAAAALLGLCAGAVPARAQATLPTGFTDQPIVSGLDQPVGMAFLPDSRVLVVEQRTANVILVRLGPPATKTTILTVPGVESGGNEQGLLGIAVDPVWPARPYIYVQYDHTGNVIWISRFTVAGDLSFSGTGALTIDPATRYDILTDLPDNATNHNGGTLRFGPDGMLYSSLGDDGDGCPAQDLTVLIGKILRLEVSTLPAGAGGPPVTSEITPSDNPFFSNSDPNARLVYLFGLRNPFRFAIDRPTGGLAIGDVGEVTQEELDYVASAGANLEWPVREGFAAGPSSCSGVDQSRFTDPVYAYDHTARMAIIGGPVYRRPASGPERFPAEYEGDVFLSEYYVGFMRRLHRTGNSWAIAAAVDGQPGPEDWATGMAHVSDYLVGPSGALWYCRQSDASFGPGTGEIRRIASDLGGGPPIVPPDSPPGPVLFAPYPSPAVGSVSFPYQLTSDAIVSANLYDLRGHHVRTLVDGEPRIGGAQTEFWDGRDDDGRDAPAGVYFVRLEANGGRGERRFALFR